LKAHWGNIAAADFFTTEVWTWEGLVTYYTVFIIDLASRRVQTLGSTPHPEALFMQQVVRTLTMAEPRVVSLRSGSEIEPGCSASAPGRGHPRGADPRAGAQREGLRFTLHLIGLIRKKGVDSSV
jgi:hypothetical protein